MFAIARLVGIHDKRWKNPLEELPPGSTILLGTRLEVQPEIAHRLVARDLSAIFLFANYQAQVLDLA